ncbi:gamma carbonic anhydrase family protein [Paenibacillus psychroresistens]|uniref:Gamma carbonic anhydrase family protein n=1 Tax=Paenibacillus psychroresistens TaxID=1778678 RepID=A0A6B8RMT5_9BACL|nr:gamma carbonic anhydrase family protein [Paenibacillus psychroresistens]QGQ96855.1 gamma carbonic anhydrase family protein [Paenibacillus psychroresistens]
MQISYKGIYPTIEKDVFLAEGTQIIGDVTIHQDASIWYNTVLRGDLAPIYIGHKTNIQDGCVGHVNTNQPLWVDDEVSVGHGAIIHGCSIAKGSLIGMGAIVLNGADIGEYALIGAGSIVTENYRIPPFTLSFGSPARVIRELTEQDLLRMKKTMESYVIKGLEYRQELTNNEI